MKIIARIRSDFPTKFGIPRQSGRVEKLTARVVFEPEYRVREAVREWKIFLISGCSGNFLRQSVRTGHYVRPPRLGGNERMGVFATISSSCPNPVGLSCVKLKRSIWRVRSSVLIVSGADLMEAPIYDIKPYLPAADRHPEALGGSAQKWSSIS